MRSVARPAVQRVGNLDGAIALAMKMVHAAEQAATIANRAPHAWVTLEAAIILRKLYLGTKKAPTPRRDAGTYSWCRHCRHPSPSQSVPRFVSQSMVPW